MGISTSLKILISSTYLSRSCRQYSQADIRTRLHLHSFRCRYRRSRTLYLRMVVVLQHKTESQRRQRCVVSFKCTGYNNEDVTYDFHISCRCILPDTCKRILSARWRSCKYRHSCKVRCHMAVEQLLQKNNTSIILCQSILSASSVGFRVPTCLQSCSMNQAVITRSTKKSISYAFRSVCPSSQSSIGTCIFRLLRRCKCHRLDMGHSRKVAHSELE